MSSSFDDRPVGSTAAAPARSEKRRGGRIIGAIIALIVLIIIVVVVAAIIGHNNASPAAKKDVTVSSCASDPAGGKPTAKGAIVNNSSKTSNYVVRLKFLDESGNQVTEGVDGAKGVKAHETIPFTLTGDRSAKGTLKCEVTGVTRTHIPGQ